MNNKFFTWTWKLYRGKGLKFKVSAVSNVWVLIPRRQITVLLFRSLQVPLKSGKVYASMNGCYTKTNPQRHEVHIYETKSQ